MQNNMLKITDGDDVQQIPHQKEHDPFPFFRMNAAVVLPYAVSPDQNKHMKQQKGGCHDRFIKHPGQKINEFDDMKSGHDVNEKTGKEQMPCQTDILILMHAFVHGTIISGKQPVDCSGWNGLIVHSMKKKTLYSVHDLCELSGVSRKTLWYYDHAGLLKPVRRSGNQKAKLYDDSSLNELKKIIRYRKAGLMISEIRSIQKAGKREITQILISALQRLEQKENELTAEKTLLKEMISEVDHSVIFTHSEE